MPLVCGSSQARDRTHASVVTCDGNARSLTQLYCKGISSMIQLWRGRLRQWVGGRAGKQGPLELMPEAQRLGTMFRKCQLSAGMAVLKASEASSSERTRLLSKGADLVSLRAWSHTPEVN